jgi:chromosome segregation ATPase
MNNRLSFLSLTFALVFLTFSLNSFAQSIAEVARQERERQKSARSTVVITSQTRTTTAESPSTTSTPAAATATTAAAGSSGPTDNNGRDEKYWRAAFQKARDDAKRAETKVEVLDLRVKDLNTQLLRQSDIYNKENRVGADITAAQKELEDARKETEQAKKKVTDLEDELRKSGGPAGWAR